MHADWLISERLFYVSISYSNTRESLEERETDVKIQCTSHR